MLMTPSMIHVTKSDGTALATGGRGGERNTLSFRPVNTSLQGVFDVLKHEAGARPGVMGANVSDYRDVHRRLGPFIRSWRASNRQRLRLRQRARQEQGREQPPQVGLYNLNSVYP
jgi:hypothetical protein